jgi:hypothetical protein
LWDRVVFFCVFDTLVVSAWISAELLAETVSWIWTAPEYKRAIDPMLLLAAPLLAFSINLYSLVLEAMNLMLGLCAWAADLQILCRQAADPSCLEEKVLPLLNKGVHQLPLIGH